MKKRVLSLILAVLMVLSVMPVMTLSIFGAEEGSETTTPATIEYNDLYVKDGLVAWFRGEDVNGSSPSKDALGNGLWIYSGGYDSETGALKYGRVGYSQDTLDKIIDKETGDQIDHKVENDFTAEAVFKSVHASGQANGSIFHAGVFSLYLPATGMMNRYLSSWNVKTGAKHNTVTLNTYKNSAMYSGDANPWSSDPNRMFSYTFKCDITVSETPYKYVDGVYTNGTDVLNIKNAQSLVTSGAMYGKYLVQNATGEAAEDYESVKVLEDGIYKLRFARHDNFNNFSGYSTSAGATYEDGTPVSVLNNDLAKVIPAIEDDLPFDGYIKTEEYVDGVQYKMNNETTYPFVYGTHGDDVDPVTGENRNETLWDGNMFSVQISSTTNWYGASNFVLGSPNVLAYQIRLYDRLLTDAEVAQNHFADVAKIKALDKATLALLVSLPAELQAKVHQAFSKVPVSDEYTTEALDAKLEMAISDAFVELYAPENEADEAFKTLASALASKVNLLDYITLPEINTTFINKKILADGKTSADFADDAAAQEYFDGLFAAYKWDYSALESCPEYFKADLEAICFAATSQGEIDKAAAVFTGLDLSGLNALSADFKAKAEADIAEDKATLIAYAKAGETANAQAWLDAIVDAVVDAIYKDYDALYVKNGLYSHLNFLEASEANNTSKWLSMGTEVSSGYTFDATGANEELQKYVKINTAEETYTLVNTGVYYYTVNGNATLYPTESDPALLTADGKISVVTGNTLRFGEGFICSPWHMVGSYATGVGETPTAFNKSSHGSTLLTSGKALSAPQFANTYLNLPDVSTNKDHTIQMVMSVNNRTDQATAKDDKTAYNNYQVTGTKVASLSFFELYTGSYMYRNGYDYSLQQYFTTRDVANATWGKTVNLGNLYQIHNGWKFDPEFATAKMDFADRTTKDPAYDVYDYTQEPEEIVGIPYSYTIVSDVVANTISAGDDDKTGANSYYNAKADVKFYYGDVVLGSEYFGRLREDDLLWVPANDLSADNDSMGNSGGVAIYAIRMYNRALSEAEILQNRFADIATFYHLDLENYYLMDEDDRADAIKAFIESLAKPDLSYPTTGSGENRTSSEVVALYEAAFPSAKTIKYTDFYVTDGLKTHLNFLSATPDDVADEIEDWENVIILKEDGTYTYNDFSTANAILNRYDLTGLGGYRVDSYYGRYYKTESGAYAHAPTEDDPAILNSAGQLITYPGNTYVFGDGYIWSPYHDAGVYRDTDGEIKSIDITSMYAINENMPNGVADPTARALKYQRQHASYVVMPSHRYSPWLPSHIQDGTYQVVVAFSLGSDGKLSSANNTNGDSNLRLPHVDLAFQNGDRNLRAYYNGATFTNSTNTWSNTWTGWTAYGSSSTVPFGKAVTLTSVNKMVDSQIPEEYQFVNGTKKYAYRTNYEFYVGVGTEALFTNEDFLAQPGATEGVLNSSTGKYSTVLNKEKWDGYRWICSDTRQYNTPDVGYGGGTKIFAIRVYNRTLSSAETIQNQFADVAGFYDVDLSAMLTIPESAWVQVYPEFKDIKLDDDTVDKKDLEAKIAKKVEEINGYGAAELLDFEGYAVRNLEYNGIRSIYTINEEKLAELEAAGYSVEFGALLAIADGRTADEIVGEVAANGDFAASVERALTVKVYDGGSYTGKYFKNDATGEKQFACTITFKGDLANEANLTTDLIFRSYVVLTKDGETTVVYPDNTSKTFDNELSLRDVAKKYYDLGLGYYRLVQDALATCGDITLTGTNYTVSGADLADYTIIPSGDTMKFALELREAIKTATGYELPIAQEAVNAGLALYIGHDTKTHTEAGLWEVNFGGTSVSMKGHGVAETKAAIAAFVALLDGVNTEIPTENNLVPDIEVALAGYTVIYAEGFAPSAETFAAAVNAACGETLSLASIGTTVEGRKIVINAPDTENFHEDSYKISFSADGDIFVYGGSEQMILDAVAFLESLLTENGIMMNANGFEKKHNYAQAGLKVNGTPIKDYAIVANTDFYGSRIAAEYLQAEIAAKTGHKLAIVSETAGAAFVIDETTSADRRKSITLNGETVALDNGYYYIDVVGKTITLSGAGASGAYTATKDLVSQIEDKLELTVTTSSAPMFTLNNTKACLEAGTLNFAMWGDSVGEAKNCSLELEEHLKLDQCDCYPPASFLADWLTRDYPNATINMINPSQGGRNTAWGVYYIDESIIDVGNTDLVMISLGTNDSPYGLGYAESALNYQSMIEKIRRANPNADIVFLMYGRIHEVKNMVTGGDVQFMRAMFDIADHYNIPIVDTTYKMNELCDVASNSDYNTNAEWIKWFTDEGGNDQVHPNNTGYELYANIFYQSLFTAIDAAEGADLVAHEMPERIYENSKINGKRYYGANAESVAAINVDYETGNWLGKDGAKNGWTYTVGSSVTFDFEGIGFELYTSTNRDNPPKILVEVFDENGTLLNEWTKTQECRNAYYWTGAMGLPAGKYTAKITAVDIDTTAGFRIIDFSIIGDPNPETPGFFEINLSETLSDLSTQYTTDTSVKSADTVYDRFLLAKNELPEEVTVLDELKPADYPLLNTKKQVYVSATKGDDRNTGSKIMPFKTIQAALAAMEGEGGGVIWVEGGNYYSEEPVLVSPAHSGTADTPLFIVGYGDEPVVVSGGKKLSSESFAKVNTATDAVASRLKSSVQSSVYSIDLEALGWTADDVVLGGGKLVINGEGYHVARFPNLYTENGKVIDNDDLLYVKTVEKVGSVNNAASTLPYNPGTEGFKITVGGKDTASYYSEMAEIGTWENTGKLFLSGSVYTHWHSGKYQIADFYDDGSLHIESTVPCNYGAVASTDNNFYIYNAIEALDAPGEFFIDVDTMTLYVYPMESSLDGASVVYAGAQLVDSNGAARKDYGAITVNGRGNNQKISEAVQYVVIDGIDVDSSTWVGYYVSYSENIIIQNAVVKNTNYTGVRFERCYNSALTYSEIYRGVGVAYYDDNVKTYTADLKPSNILIQNNKFYEPAVGSQYAVEVRDGIRVVVSHNDFEYCCVTLSGFEHIVEYNEFQGGSKDVTDGGMVYTTNYKTQGGYHVRYNVFHMFDASKRAVYNDGKSGGNYAYGNLMNMRGSTVAEGLNPWYSSSGHGNVCFENVMILRDYEEEYLPLNPTIQNGYGDSVLESSLFYYYKDSKYGSNQAASWLVEGGRAQEEVDLMIGGTSASYNLDVIKARFPDHANYLETVKIILAAYAGELDNTYTNPAYDVAKAKGVNYTYVAPTDMTVYIPAHQYMGGILGTSVNSVAARTVTLNEGDTLTLTYEELSAIERLWRQGAMTVIKDNVIIGGGYTDTSNGTAERKSLYNASDSKAGFITGMSKVENNFIAQDTAVMPGLTAGSYEISNYEISDETWATIASSVSSVEGLKKENYKNAGRTHAEFAD